MLDAPGGKYPTDVDEIICDDAEPDPTFHAGVSFVATPRQSVSPLHHADPAFTSGPPALPVFEPAFLLFPLARGTLGGSIGNTDSFDALRVRGVFIGARVECGVRGHETRRLSKDLRMRRDGRQEQIAIARPLVVDLVVRDDLLLRLLELQQLAELIGFARLPFADKFGARFEETEEFPVRVRIAPQDARPRLAKDLLDPRHEGVQFLTEPLQGDLLHHVGGAFDTRANLLRKALGLSHDAAGAGEQALIRVRQFLLAQRALGARDPADLHEAPVDTAAPVAQPRADRAGDRRHLPH